MFEKLDNFPGYNQYRPTYPQAAIAKILQGLNPTQIVAADIGAGTGIGSRLLADQGVRVMAIEPITAMSNAATAHPKIQFISGTAEQIPLATASVNLVTSFQAFHWFDFLPSLREFHRILTPNGRLALIWNFWDQKDHLSRHYTQLLYQMSSQAETVNLKKFETSFQSLCYQLFWQGLWLPYFQNLKRYNFKFQQWLDRQGLIGLAQSQGFTPQSGEALQALNSQLSKLCDNFSNPQGLVRLVYDTRLYRADKREKN